MVDIDLVTPVGKIIVSGAEPPIVTERTITTVANCYPGRLVKTGSTDRDIVVNDAGLPLGWLGYEQADPNYKPATPATIYVVGDHVPVVRGGGFIILGTLATNQTIVIGDRLVPAADGMLQKATALSVKVATGATPVTSTGAQPTIAAAGDVGVLPVVAIAEESVKTTTTAANIKARSLI